MHQSIDWFSWLSKTGLEPSIIYEYGMAFCRNELEEDDIAYFNHEFLQSMGISIAKHRLEILKLVRKQRGSNGLHPISKLVIAIKRTKRSLGRCIRAWMHPDDSSLVLVSKSYGSGYWKGNMLRRNKRLVTIKQATTTPTLLLTNGNYHKSNSFKVNTFSCPLDYDLEHDQDKKEGGDHDGHARFDEEEGGGYWAGGGVKEIKWDTMFQNLKPT
ncbi:putative sterile alpha motif domain-containing protein [Helianthus annuus]|nr:putative sterile alpha motif domain-containing protein [Helianthus annuus]